MSLRSRHPKDFRRPKVFRDSRADLLLLWATCQPGFLRFRLQAILQLSSQRPLPWILWTGSRAHLAAHGWPANLLQVCRSAPASQRTNTRHQRSAFRRGDDSPRIHQVKKVGAFQAVVVCRKKRIPRAMLPCCPGKSINQFLGLLFVQLKLSTDRFGVAAIEAVLRELLLLGQTDIAVGLVRRPSKIVDALHALEEGKNALEPVSQFHGDRVKVDPPALLEVSELGDF